MLSDLSGLLVHWTDVDATLGELIAWPLDHLLVLEDIQEHHQ